MAFQKYRSILMILLLLTVLQAAQGQDGYVAKPTLTTVTVDTSDHNVVLSWSPSSTPNISYYVIYYLIGTTGYEIDTVWGNSTFQYKHITDPSSPYTYTVTAETETGDIADLGGDYHRTVALNISYDSCNAEMNLEWEKYIGWKSHTSGYRVLCNDGSGTFSEVALLDTSQLSFTHTGIQENQNYEYLIKVFDNRGRTSFSNIRTYRTVMPEPPDFLNLDYVSVLDDQMLEISFSTDLSSEINDFRLMRALANPVNFKDLTTLRGVNQSPYSFNDQIATQGVRAYYRIEALNSCQNPVDTSNTASNILLSGKVEGTTAQLNWTPYEEYEGGISGYEIYRMNQSGEFEPVDPTRTLHEGVSYFDNLSDIGQDRLKGEIRYQIVAVEGDNNPYPEHIKGRSASNVLTIAVETQLRVPNAFSPTSNDPMNQKFGPVMDFTPSSYRMIIYDRTGKVLFQTYDPYDGWDGKLNSSADARQGVYIYHIQYTSYSGHREVLTGNLSLVH